MDTQQASAVLYWIAILRFGRALGVEIVSGENTLRTTALIFTLFKTVGERSYKLRLRKKELKWLIGVMESDPQTCIYTDCEERFLHITANENMIEIKQTTPNPWDNGKPRDQKVLITRDEWQSLRDIMRLVDKVMTFDLTKLEAERVSKLVHNLWSDKMVKESSYSSSYYENPRFRNVLEKLSAILKLDLQLMPEVARGLTRLINDHSVAMHEKMRCFRGDDYNEVELIRILIDHLVLDDY